MIIRILGCLVILGVIHLPVAAQRPISEVPSDVTFHKLAYHGNAFWAVDYGQGRILKSTDSGQHWAILADLDAEYFERIQFLDARTGYVAGDYGYVYKSVDGGHTWMEISPPVPDRITEPYRNHPGKDQKPDGAFVAYYGMVFQDVEHGYVSGFWYNPKEGFRASYQTLFFVTHDGGSSWEHVEPSEVDGAREAILEQQSKQQVAWESVFHLDPMQAWRVQRQRDGTFEVERTADGGDTWLSATLPIGAEQRWIARRVVFANASEGYVFGGRLDAETNTPIDEAVVFHSADGGATWQMLDTDWSHIHDAVVTQGDVWIAGSAGLFMRVES